jgi:hypothetical protein
LMKVTDHLRLSLHLLDMITSRISHRYKWNANNNCLQLCSCKKWEILFGH